MWAAEREGLGKGTRFRLLRDGETLPFGEFFGVGRRIPDQLEDQDRNLAGFVPVNGVSVAAPAGCRLIDKVVFQLLSQILAHIEFTQYVFVDQ